MKQHLKQQNLSIMKKLILTLTAIGILTALGFTGCSKNESGGTTIDTAKVQAVFAAASSADKSEVDKAIASIKNNDYPAALTALKQAAANVKLTPDQQQALKDLVAQVQAKITEAANQAIQGSKGAATDATKAATDLQKSVTK